MTGEKEIANEGFFTKLWGKLKDIAEIVEVSETELLARRIERIERQLIDSKQQQG